MAVDIAQSLIDELAAAAQQTDTLQRALTEERHTSDRLAREVGEAQYKIMDLHDEIRRLESELAAVHVGQSVTTAAMPDAAAERQTATVHIARLAMATGTAESTVRGNLTLSPMFAALRDNAAAVDGMPLTQSERLTDWLCDTVPDQYNHFRTRYEQLLRRWLSIESML